MWLYFIIIGAIFKCWEVFTVAGMKVVTNAWVGGVAIAKSKCLRLWLKYLGYQGKIGWGIRGRYDWVAKWI